MPYTEFYTQTTGSNLNSGSTTSDTAAYTATNGGWDSTTGVFTPASGDPSASVSVGDFASVYPDADTVTPFVGRVTAVSSTTITVSLTAKSGIAPTTAGSGLSVKVGGAWQGPNGSSGFPFNFVEGTLVNVSDDPCRVNLKNNATYSVTASVEHSVAGNGVVFSGYTTTAGDGGKAIIDGGTTGSSYVVLNLGVNARGTIVQDLIIQNNGDTGSANGITINVASQGIVLQGVVVRDVRGTGIANSGGSTLLYECEAYGCNQSNTANLAGISVVTGLACVRCIAHHNTGSNSHGFYAAGNNITFSFINCIADSNGASGFRQLGGSNNNKVMLFGCDAYNNSGDGLLVSGGGTVGLVIAENCNFISNGGYGIGVTSTTNTTLLVTNCGFGSGTAANTSGTIQAAGFGSTVRGIETGTVNYTANVTPWVDPANGDFRINLAGAKNAGRGEFTQEQSGYAGTVGYPDIGAAQYEDTGGGGGLLVHPGMSGGMRG